MGKALLGCHDDGTGKDDNGDDNPENNEPLIAVATTLKVTVFTAGATLLHEAVIVLLEEGSLYLAHDVQEYAHKNEQGGTTEELGDDGVQVTPNRQQGRQEVDECEEE